ncbi:MFS efflux pump atnC [Paramyrothecium foliicola]|nr:MFS efflux pump atnC [Paramyrothecium foliicola]
MSDVELDMTDEDAPLLDAGERADEPISSRPRFIALRWQARSPRTIIFLLALIKFSVVCNGMLLLLPVYRLIEDSLCHVYYEDDSLDIIPEMKCKVDAVQSQLTFLMGWLGLLNSLATFVAAYPYGMMSDRIGRKPTVLLSYGGLALSFAFAPVVLKGMAFAIRRHPYFIMLGAPFQLVGGGVPVLIATLYAIAADVSEEKEKAANFLYLTFGATAGGLLGPLMAGSLMHRFGPWVPIYIVVATIPLVFSIFIFLPETLTPSAKSEGHRVAGSFKEQALHGLKDLFSSVRMLGNVNILLILLTFLFQNARFHAYTQMLTQYISKHFGWTLAETSFLLSPLGLLNLVVLAALPKLSEFLMSSRVGYTGPGKDLFLTRVSTALLILGAVIEVFSRDVATFIFGLFVGTFGAADSPLARAAVSHYVEPEYTSRLYALIGMTEVLGSFIGPPVLAWCFATGLRLKGVWTSLPWMYMALLCSIALVALCFVRPPRRRVSEERADEDDIGIR